MESLLGFIVFILFLCAFWSGTNFLMWLAFRKALYSEHRPWNWRILVLPDMYDRWRVVNFFQREIDSHNAELDERSHDVEDIEE